MSLSFTFWTLPSWQAGGLVIALLGALALILALLVYLLTFHPKPVQTEHVVSLGERNPPSSAFDELKLMTWNVHYMAGQDYLFYFDSAEGPGPTEKPSLERMEENTAEIARVINDERADIVYLQEIHENDAPTHHVDQLSALLAQLEGYRCYTQTFYWKSHFVPHPKIMGSVGKKLVTLSRLPLSKALRYQLPRVKMNPVSSQFYLKRAVLEAGLPREDAEPVHLLNTHLDAFGLGDTMQRQVAYLEDLLAEKERLDVPWILAGDFNMLASSSCYERLHEVMRPFFNPETELQPLVDRYRCVPSVEDVSGDDYERWLTLFPNVHPAVTGPDRTIDFIFYSSHLELLEKRVRREDTEGISDHYPIIARFRL